MRHNVWPYVLVLENLLYEVVVILFMEKSIGTQNLKYSLKQRYTCQIEKCKVLQFFPK